MTFPSLLEIAQSKDAEYFAEEQNLLQLAASVIVFKPNNSEELLRRLTQFEDLSTLTGTAYRV